MKIVIAIVFLISLFVTYVTIMDQITNILDGIFNKRGSVHFWTIIFPCIFWTIFYYLTTQL